MARLGAIQRVGNGSGDTSLPNAGWPGQEERRGHRVARDRARHDGQDAAVANNRDERHETTLLPPPVVTLHDRQLECAFAIQIQRSNVKRERRLHPLVNRMREERGEAAAVPLQVVWGHVREQ